jgi:formate dehydrogenase major subunit
MMADGRAWLYTPTGLLDGPLPTHYEPIESPVRNPLYPEVGASPVAITWNRPENPLNPMQSGAYPVIASTFRLTEHHTTGPMSRNLPWLAELQPELYAEIDPVLAADRGIEDRGWMVISTERGEVQARAMVTRRVGPLRVDGRLVHQISVPWHWGNYASSEQGVTGDSLNDLIVLSGDPNTSIEDKTFSCQVRAGRRARETTQKLAGAHGGEMPTSADHEAESPDTLFQTPQSGREPPPQSA